MLLPARWNQKHLPPPPYRQRVRSYFAIALASHGQGRARSEARSLRGAWAEAGAAGRTR